MGTTVFYLFINPLKCSGIRRLHFKVFNAFPRLTYTINFWHSGTLALSPERQSARTSEIKNGRLGLYDAEYFEM